MSTNNNELAEECFINVHAKICEYGELMQPDKDERWSLPEIIITSLTTTVFVAFFNGLFGEIGKDLYAAIKKKMAKKRKLDYVEPEKIINELATMLNKNLIQENDFKKAELKIYERLQELEISDNHSNKIAKEVTEIIKQIYINDK